MIQILPMTTDSINTDTLLQAYDYELPPGLIAQRPIEGRSGSKLLVYRAATDEISHHIFSDIADILPSDHLLVFNNSRVFPCRLRGKKSTGGQAEVFLLNLNPPQYDALIRTRGKKNIGDEFFFSDGLVAKVEEIKDDGVFSLSFNTNDLKQILYAQGEIPIPPYIRDGESDKKDKEDYQTVYAKKEGSVAAPTAGLHFTPELIEKIPLEKAEVSLHVGPGTFKPVNCDNILDHPMHREYFEIDDFEAQKIKQFGNKIIAVGTTSLRVLESIARNHFETDESGMSTDIFIHPPQKVESIKGIITNFHLPKSTLLMLVSSLVGREKTLELYKIAIENQYRFYSYGDAMLILL